MIASSAPARTIVLASSSPYRAELLRRIVPEFEQIAPGVDESALESETVAAQVERLSRAKARAIAAIRPGALVVASDQLAQTSDGGQLGKPGNAFGAAAQLHELSGTEVRFLTGVCVLGGHSDAESYLMIETRVRLRVLSDVTIANYVALERPFDCAGSFKAESLGIALFEWVRSDDPTALIGLPLIATATLLREAGFDALGDDTSRGLLSSPG
ncbi:MAG: Maf family nucleotide pyrophosphatase [Lysobacterales bacterium]